MRNALGGKYLFQKTWKQKVIIHTVRIVPTKLRATQKVTDTNQKEGRNIKGEMKNEVC